MARESVESHVCTYIMYTYFFYCLPLKGSPKHFFPRGLWHRTRRIPDFFFPETMSLPLTHGHSQCVSFTWFARTASRATILSTTIYLFFFFTLYVLACVHVFCWKSFVKSVKAKFLFSWTAGTFYVIWNYISD